MFLLSIPPVQVVEGYGQTESTAGIAFNIPGEYVSGHVGPPLPCNVVKLIDVPEMDYYAKENKGEVDINEKDENHYETTCSNNELCRGFSYLSLIFP